MDKDKIVKAFDDFVEERYGDSEETLRGEIRKAVNDHIKDKLDLQNDPLDIPQEETADDE